MKVVMHVMPELADNTAYVSADIYERLKGMFSQQGKRNDVIDAAKIGMEMEADINCGAPDPHWMELYTALKALEVE